MSGSGDAQELGSGGVGAKEIDAEIPLGSTPRLLGSSAPLLKIWLFSRIFIAFFVVLGHVSHPFQEKIEGGYIGVSNWFLNPWTTFDSRHFLSIASQGYGGAETTPFFPLYPLLLRPFGPDENRMALAGIVFSNLAFLGALILFWQLTREIYGEKVARRGVWLLAFFPAGAYGMAVYTESLFLLVALGAFWCARHKKWWGAAACALLAALTRNSGPILALALLFEWMRTRKRGEWPTLGALAAMGAPALAFFGMQTYFRARFGAGVSSISAQAIYGRAPSFPTTPLWRDFLEIISGRGLELVTILNWGATLLAIVLLWRHRRTLPRADAIFLGGVLMVQLCFARIWPPFTIASLRYLFSTWPFTQMIALEIEKVRLNRLRLITLCAIYALLCAVHSYLFGLKSFLG